MSLPIVEIDVTVNNPGIPSTLLKTGAFISQGGTNLAPGTMHLLTTKNDLTAILSATPADTVELQSMNTTYWAQGSTQAVFVLELGKPTIPANEATEGAAALSTFLADNPNTVFALLCPDSWGSSVVVETLVASYGAPSAMVYFFITTTLTDYTIWITNGVGPKAAFLLVEAPLTPATEHSLAAIFYRVLKPNPSSATPASMLCFGFVYGVTPYPEFGNKTVLTQLKQANAGYITTAAEGGLSEFMLVWGHTMDGMQWGYWYSIAWTIIHINQALANEVINGSQGGPAPLKYNEFGITRLQNRAAKTLRQGVTSGLILGTVITVNLDPQVFSENYSNGLYAGNAVINAVPFQIYADMNPQDYGIGKYAGLQCVMTPALGFESILVNLQVTLFV